MQSCAGEFGVGSNRTEDGVELRLAVADRRTKVKLWTPASDAIDHDTAA